MGASVDPACHQVTAIGKPAEVGDQPAPRPVEQERGNLWKNNAQDWSGPQGQQWARIWIKVAVRECPWTEVGLLESTAAQPAAEQVAGFMAEHHHAPRSGQQAGESEPTHAVPL